MAKFKLPKLPKLQLAKILGLAKYNKGPIFLILAIAVLVLNFVIQPFAFRLDFSKNKANTLSDSSKQVLRNLENKVTITFFQSAELPSRIQPFRQDINDLLAEYRREGGGRVTIDVKDPKTDDKAREKAAGAGIGEIQFSEMDQDKFNVSTGYFGLLISHNGQDRPVQQLNDLDNLEYNITSTIYSMSRKESPKIAMLGAEPSFNPMSGQNDPVGVLRQILQQQYTVEDLNFEQSAATDAQDPSAPTPTSAPLKDIDGSFKTVMVFTGGKPYSAEEYDKLRKYITNKGKVIAFAEGISVDEQFLATGEARTDMNALTEPFGITINKNLVLSASAELVNFGSEVQSFLVPYPYWMRSNVFNPEVSYFSNVNFLTFPWASSLKVENKNGYEARMLVQTDKQSWVQSGSYTIAPQEAAQQKPTSFGQYGIMAESSKKDGGSLLVIPAARFGYTQYMSRETGNINFLLNVVNDYASQGALSGIRQRAVTLYPIPSLPNGQRDLFKYANMLLLPVLFALGGGIYLMKRK